jgi:ribA/ribD-fused uncharacterized protein
MTTTTTSSKRSHSEDIPKKNKKKRLGSAPLYFYSTRPGKVGSTYSNFSNHPFFADGKPYRTNEHYFQSRKFEKTDPEWAEKIRSCVSPSAAKKKGGSKDHPLRADWDLVKETIMYRGLELKALYNEDFVSDLLASKDRTLIENSPSDYYWGNGHLKTGQNRLGHLLMCLRDQIRDQSEWKEKLRKRLELKKKMSNVICTKQQWEEHVHLLGGTSTKEEKSINTG